MGRLLLGRRAPASALKTDRRDSHKLAHLLAKGMLKRVWVHSDEERYYSQVVRRSRQLVRDRVRTQSRIKAELRFYAYIWKNHEADGHRYTFETLRRITFDWVNAFLS